MPRPNATVNVRLTYEQLAQLKDALIALYEWDDIADEILMGTIVNSMRLLEHEADCGHDRLPIQE